MAAARNRHVDGLGGAGENRARPQWWRRLREMLAGAGAIFYSYGVRRRNAMAAWREATVRGVHHRETP